MKAIKHTVKIVTIIMSICLLIVRNAYITYASETGENNQIDNKNYYLAEELFYSDTLIDEVLEDIRPQKNDVRQVLLSY